MWNLPISEITFDKVREFCQEGHKEELDLDYKGDWPNDDGKSGYRGRWGPFVADDLYLRRAGMLFPEFWRMFFIALAKL